MRLPGACAVLPYFYTLNHVYSRRLPRKYSSDRHRDTSAPIVGSSGATPLHFAAANGHEHVVLTLLLHGALPDRPDKHNVTPEMLARQNGWTRCAELLRKWTLEKDRDLRERATLAPELEASSRNECDFRPFDKKLKVKRSIDNALNMIRPALPTPPSSGQICEDASYATSSPPMHGSASLDSSPDTSSAQEFPPRRPSLPHIFDAAPHAYGHSHSQSSSTQQHPGKSSGRPSFSSSSSRRPRSAGTDAEASSVTASASASSTPGRLRGKISLLHMFKKSAGDSAASSPGAPTTPESRDSFSGSGYASSSSLVTSASASPAPERERAERERERSRGASVNSPLRTRASESGLLSAASSSQAYNATLTTVPSSRSRLGSESQSQSQNQSLASSTDTFPPLAVELHRKLSMERLRHRSGSGSSTNPAETQTQTQTPAKAQTQTQTQTQAQSPSPQPQPQAPSVPQSQLQGHRSPPMRPGILRPHGRSASSGQSQLQPPALQDGSGSARSLRFDSSSTGASVSTKRSALGLDLKLKASGSVSSLRGETRSGTASPRSPWSASSQQRLRDQESRDTLSRRQQAAVADDDDDEGYGEVISPRIGLGLGLVEGKSRTRLRELRSESGQPLQRRPSAGSQLSRHSSTGSTLPSPTAAAAQDPGGFDCPFSINRPPIQTLSSDEQQQQPSAITAITSNTTTTTATDSQRSLLGIHGVDNRGRGDSIGSMSTSTDASMPQTPGPTPGLGLEIRSPDSTELELPLEVEAELEEREREKAAHPRSRTDSSASGTGYFSDRERERDRERALSPQRVRAPPLDIDIRAISSHAQAEALVQRAQKSILDREDVDIELPGLGLVNGSGSAGLTAAGSAGLGSASGTGGAAPGSGRTPLSAKLAAYGESLAIERRFKEREREERARGGRTPPERESVDTPVGSPRTPSQSQMRTRSRGELRLRRSESGVRKFSLEERPALAPVGASRRNKQRRPHTADGECILVRWMFMHVANRCVRTAGETSDHGGGFLSPGHRQLSPGHKPSFSGSAISSARSSPSASDNTFVRTPASSRTLPVISSPSLIDTPPRIVRSRTPDPEAHFYDMPSPVSSPSRPGFGSGDTFGVPLSRVSTAPPRHASPDIVPQRTYSEQQRERARANKLMKMGLLAHDVFPRAHSPYGHGHAHAHARNGGGSGGAAGIAGGGGAAAGGSGGKQRFGGIRGFVQTLTGKT